MTGSPARRLWRGAGPADAKTRRGAGGGTHRARGASRPRTRPARPARPASAHSLLCGGGEKGFDERVEVAVEDGVDTAGFVPGPVILDELVGFEHVGPD